MILLVLEEFVIDRFQKKFHQVDVATEADHVVDDQDHVTVAPAQEYNHYLLNGNGKLLFRVVVVEEAVMNDHTEPVTV